MHMYTVHCVNSKREHFYPAISHSHTFTMNLFWAHWMLLLSSPKIVTFKFATNTSQCSTCFFTMLQKEYQGLSIRGRGHVVSLALSLHYSRIFLYMYHWRNERNNIRVWAFQGEGMWCPWQRRCNTPVSSHTGTIDGLHRGREGLVVQAGQLQV